ncbi:sigma-70 family RNA polymerase sigma factor [Marinilongibacter aquaticus]|uniref:RNA polymerase sigma factor n=1 Tax=Marinilongibacter aquaticus TaxID=2975157 RepID=UPI0021BD3B52|nr:sigma-70 family RNA polymerase sigma factor [Marinilongibacter aquaticus]UBM59176.1 sigma-70 family RNA polymerase sigma factor [Marinilongibacter aquaticus]
MTELEKTIGEAQAGNEQAFRSLFEAYGSMVFSIGLRYMGDQDAAKDLLQETFIKLHSKIKNYEFKGSFEGWLKRMAVNTAVDEIRKHRIWSLAERMEENMWEASALSSEEILSELSAQELLELIRALPTAYGLVFNLYVIEGYKHTEIAKMLGISEGTSKSNLHDARKLLRKRVNLIMNG